MGYLSANFERGSQLSVFGGGMSRLDFKPAMEEEEGVRWRERKQRPDEGVVRVRREAGSLMVSHDCNVSLSFPGHDGKRFRKENGRKQ